MFRLRNRIQNSNNPKKPKSNENQTKENKTTMNITVAQPTRFKRVFEVLKELYIDLEIKFDQNGFGFLLVDKFEICFGHLRIPNRPDQFPVYEVKKPLKICVNMARFCTALHPLSNEHTLHLSVPEDQADHPSQLFLQMEDKSEKPDFLGNERTIVLKLSTPQDEDGEDFKNISFDRTMQIDSQKLRSYINDLAGINEKVMVTITDKELVLNCNNESMDYNLKIGCVSMPQENYVTLKDGAEDGEQQQAALPAPVTELSSKDPVLGVFPFKYMKLFVKAQDLSDNVLLSMSNNGPMLWRFVMENYGVLQFFLAPISVEKSPFDDPIIDAPMDAELMA